MNVNETQREVKRNSDIESALDALHSEVGHQNNLITDLVMRLKPVLIPAVPSKEEPLVARSAQTEVAKSISDMVNQLRSHNEALNEVIQRLGV